MVGCPSSCGWWKRYRKSVQWCVRHEPEHWRETCCSTRFSNTKVRKGRGLDIRRQVFPSFMKVLTQKFIYFTYLLRGGVSSKGEVMSFQENIFYNLNKLKHRQIHRKSWKFLFFFYPMIFSKETLLFLILNAFSV